ncbi:MAG: aminodeoxychorismate synthase component I [Terracidiphilus sp.]|jgi:para-aminobenzoate synthetase/4-amino-4-deoxychorismate lyase
MNTYAKLPARHHSLIASNPGSVLLQTSRYDAENHRSFFFIRPERTLTASRELLDEIEEALAGGLFVAGFFGYECGEGLEALRHGELPKTNVPVSWFGVYSRAFVFDHRKGEFEGDSPDELEEDSPHCDPDFEVRNPQFGIAIDSYAEKLLRIKEYIRAGDTYQVNFTDKLHFELKGMPGAMYSALIESQQVQYGAYINGEGWQVLSFSPELFFRVKDGRIVTRPMKGTVRRGVDKAEDDLLAQALQNDAKNRSENVMIVDLLRNDLGRICEYGSVRAERLFTVEKYETLFQMTSEITGALRPGVRYAEIFASLFPCGSITGAPKHRTMEIIQELECGPRGVYTGAIGFFSPAREAVFSVPIRTVVLDNNHGAMGVGSGIVIDSQAEEEFRECMLKTEFLTRREERFELLESILWNDGYVLLREHLERMQSSAEYFEFKFDRETVIAALEEIENYFERGKRIKVRIQLERGGAVKITHARAAELAGMERVMISAKRVFSGDRFLRHKTTRRALYELQYEEALRKGCDEVLFLNERDEATEGAMSNLFVEKDGQWLTPPVTSGALPGTYRRRMLETNPSTVERVLKLEDLLCADAVYFCNSVRGLRKVRVVQHDSRNT